MEGLGARLSGYLPHFTWISRNYLNKPHHARLKLGLACVLADWSKIGRGAYKSLRWICIPQIASGTHDLECATFCYKRVDLIV